VGIAEDLLTVAAEMFERLFLESSNTPPPDQPDSKTLKSRGKTNHG
jgi:hypothetical protein